MQKSSLILTGLLLLGACSKVKELDKRTENMEKSTEHVSATTEQMSAITQHMSNTTDDMKATTSVMYLQIRSKESEDTRDEKFQILMGKEASMGTRITAAGVYFKSMEFQLWTDNGSYDGQEALDVMHLDAANEFTRRMNDLYAEVKLKKMSPTKDRPLESSFYAVAAALHMNHAYQEEISKWKNFIPTSMYDLIKSALSKDANGEALKEHEEVLVNGINKEIMIELIKARVDIMSALALKNLTDKRQMSFGQKIKGALFKISGGSLGSIDLPQVYEESNDTTKSFVETYLDAAIKARTFLKNIGVEKRLEKTLHSALSNIEFDESKSDVRKDSIKSMIDSLLN